MVAAEEGEAAESSAAIWLWLGRRRTVDWEKREAIESPNAIQIESAAQQRSFIHRRGGTKVAEGEQTNPRVLELNKMMLMMMMMMMMMMMVVGDGWWMMVVVLCCVVFGEAYDSGGTLSVSPSPIGEW